MKKFLFLDAAFEGARMLPGAVSAAYLVSKGLTIGDIASLKMIQSATGFFFELPTGLVADHFGRRLSLLLSCFFGAIAFSLYAVSESFLIFVLAEILLAFCLCFWSGAFEAYAIDSSKSEMSEKEVHKFFHANGGVSALGTMIGGAFGAVLSSFAGFIPFALCAGIMMILVGLLLFKYPNDSKVSHLKLTEVTKAVLATVQPAVVKTLFSAESLPFYAVIAGAQFVMQPIVYYWQPWFGPWSRGHSQWKLGAIFIGIQCSLLIAGYLGRRLSDIKEVSPANLQRAAWLLFGVAIVIMSFTKTYTAGLMFFLLAEIALGIGLAGAKGNLNKLMTRTNRASVLGAASLVGRLAGLTSLAVMAAFSSWIGDDSNSLHWIYLGAGAATICFIVLERLYHAVQSFRKLPRNQYAAHIANQPRTGT